MSSYTQLTQGQCYQISALKKADHTPPAYRRPAASMDRICQPRWMQAVEDSHACAAPSGIVNLLDDTDMYPWGERRTCRYRIDLA
jgi:hypothetical protein